MTKVTGLQEPDDQCHALLSRVNALPATKARPTPRYGVFFDWLTLHIGNANIYLYRTHKRKETVQ